MHALPAKALAIRPNGVQPSNTSVHFVSSIPRTDEIDCTRENPGFKYSEEETQNGKSTPMLDESHSHNNQSPRHNQRGHSFPHTEANESPITRNLENDITGEDKEKTNGVARPN